MTPPFHRVPLIYVSGKFTAPTPEEVAENVALAVEVGHFVRSLGAEPLVPHLSVGPLPHEDPEALWRAAMRACLVQLSRCSHVVMVPNWRSSRGARIERWYALRVLRIPVFDTTTEMAARLMMEFR